MNSREIAIWAPLRYTNYGDDLQAIVIAKYLMTEGYNVIVYQLDKILAKEYNLKVAQNLDELFINAKICIIAGGALLTPASHLKRFLHQGAREYEADFRDLNFAAEKYDVKFIAISIGGDGLLRPPFFSYSNHRINFFKSKRLLGGTVRLEGDVEQVKKFGKTFDYYPDFLLSTPEFLSLVNGILKETSKKKIAVNLKKGRYLPKLLIRDIFNYTETHNDIVFYFVKTHMDHTGINYEYLPFEESENIKIIKYISPTQLLSAMLDIDLLITSKLHLGITGMTIGTPYLSYKGHGKAKSFARFIGGQWAILPVDITFQGLLDNFFHHTKENIFSKYDIQKFDQLTKDSHGHFSYLKNILQEITFG